MARQSRIEFSGAFYYVMCRGDRQEPIFEDDDDRRMFLPTLEECCEKSGWRIFAWVLMSNHHWVFQTPEASLVASIPAAIAKPPPPCLASDSKAARHRCLCRLQHNVVECVGDRQSCLAHLLRKAREIGEELTLIPQADTAAVRFCKKLKNLFQKACKVKIPASAKERECLVARFRAKLDSLCQNPLAFAKAETLRKRFLPGMS